MKIRAVISDMDGVIADSLGPHWKAWDETLGELGVSTPDSLREQVNGMSMQDALRLIKKETGADFDIDKGARLKNSKVLEAYKTTVKCFPGTVDLLNMLIQKNIRMALASSSPPEFIDIFVDRFDLRKYFSFLISGEDIKHSKPDPEIFLMCAEKLNVAPEECIVIEDAISGIEAAKRAGMGCIAIAGSHPRDELNKADFIASDLAEAKKYLTKLLQ